MFFGLQPLNNTLLPQYNPYMSSTLAESLFEWYAENARNLPWRVQTDPYAVWISEVMLQQTRVETVIPYYKRWMVRYPSVKALAEASRDEVLVQWEGLGYYQRAHHLHLAARIILAEHDGELPRQLDQLRRLPGIGPYTSAAIAAIAFNNDVIALDGNLQRVFSRLSDLTIDPRSPKGERQLLSMARGILPSGKASTFNQALMDLGATVCTPRAPTCSACPLTFFCLAFQRGSQEERPVRRSRKPPPHITAVSAVISRETEVLIGRRPEGMLLGGLWEFPGGKPEPGESLKSGLRRGLGEELGVEVELGPRLGIFKHAYTHFQVLVHAYACRLVDGEPQALEHTELRWVRPEELGEFPMGKVDRAISSTIVQGVPTNARSNT